MATGKYRYQIEPRLSRIYDDPELPLLLVPREVIIFVVTGEALSGKSTAASYLAEEYLFHRIRGREQNPTSLFKPVADALAHSSGRLKRRPPGVVIDDFYSWEQLKPLVEFFHPRPVIIALRADLAVRYTRAQNVDPHRFADEDALRRLDQEYSDKMRHLQESFFKTGGQPIEVESNRGVDEALRLLDSNVGWVSKRSVLYGK